MNEAQARKAGYEINRGSSTDDRIDRWYIERIDSDVVDRRGEGFFTKQEALDYLDFELAHPELFGSAFPR